ncbi:MAG: hypothetical protein K0U98_06735 [Deltaproteobacteria bacterium]|nr:hypothetical protein [Deltaproteobacteria bacterium]
MAKPLQYNSTLIGREDLTSSLSIFKVQPDAELAAGLATFLPGQYGVLGLNNEANPDLGSVRRPMSIVNAPEEKGALEFYVRYVGHPESDNPLTHLLWKIGEGDRMFLGPKITGKFTLEDTVGSEDRRLKICVAAGTGLAPFTSFVRSALLREPGRDLSEFVILHGASYPADLGYVDELNGLRDQHGLRYFGSVSRPKETPDWTGDVGRVEDYFLPERLAELEQRCGLADGELTPARATIFICGLQGTIGKTLTRLIPRGFVPENRKLRRALEVEKEQAASLFFEQYDTTPVIDVKDEELMVTLRQQLREGLSALA